MIKISEEMLLAYVDNELDDATRAQVDAAIAADPELARRVDQQRTLRKLLGAAYDPVLDEPVPPRLLQAAQPAKTKTKAKVLELATARKARPAATPPSHGWGWQQWGGMAACLVVGLFAGRSGWLTLPGQDIASHDGQWVARGELARALSTQLASTQPADAPVRIGLSYLSRADEYCRSFALGGARSSGLACRRGNEWELRLLAQDQAPPAAAGTLRMAASPVPPAVLRLIDEQIQGSPLDAQAERAAAQKGWRK